MGGTSHRRDDTAMSFRTLTSIDVHSPATPNQAHPVHRQLQHQQFAMSQQQHRISSAGRISPSNSSPPEFPPPRPMPRHPWQRSASCRELYASSFEDSGKARPREEKPPAAGPDEPALAPFQLPSQGELDNPVTRYDESNRSYSAASSKLPSLDHDSVPDRVYSSSYPGTSSLSTESGHEESGPAGDLSHDDLSHDSYELLEREHEFEYPESYSSPPDENEQLSDNSDEGIEHEMFQMDSETDSFVKHRSVKSSDKQLFKSVLADLKNVNGKTKSIDRYSAVQKSTEANLIVTESRIQRTGTQIERKFETRHANSVDQSSRPPLPHQDSARKDPVILQVQKQKLTVLNELKNLKPKHKITHVDSEVLRDEGIMRPKSRIDDDLSPVDPNKTILEPVARGRTVRARSIASLDDHPPRVYVETGSLGRAYASGEKRCMDADFKIEKISKLLEKERKILEREERKRIERENSREARRMEKADSRDRRSVGRVDSRERRSIERLDFGESYVRASVERQDSRDRSCERLDSRERNNGRRHEHREQRVKSVERLDSREFRKSMENLDRSPKERTSTRYQDTRERRERSIERLDSRESRKSPGRVGTVDYDQRHTLERFDSGSKSPRDRPSPRGKSVDKLDLRDRRPTFDFDPRTIERLSSLERSVVERYDSVERSNDRKSDRKSADRRGLSKLDSRERKSLDRLDSRERRSIEGLDREEVESRRSTERLDQRESRKSKSRTERGRSEDKPRERDDWKSLERARKDDERRERERQSKLSMETRTETIIGVPNERECVKGKSVFTEYEPKIIGGIVVGFDDSVLAGHIPVERTKSDPNPGRQRIGSNSKRHMLMHQKSIDLTPADSGDEDPFSDGASGRKANPDIPYTLHKRHVMNGTASDEKSESDSGKTAKIAKTAAKDLPKLPLKMVTDLSCLDLTKLTPTTTVTKQSTDKPKSILVSPDKHKTVQSPTEKTMGIASPSAKLSPTDHKSFVCHLSSKETSPAPSKVSPQDRSPTKTTSLDRYKNVTAAVAGDKTCTKSVSLEKKSSKLSPTEPNVTIISVIDRRSPKLSPTDPSVTIVSVIEKSRSPDSSSRSSDRSPIKTKLAMNLADVVGMEIKKELERRESERLKVPDDSLEKQDSIEKIPLPEIPVKIVTREKPPLPVRVSSMEKRPSSGADKSAFPVKPPVPSKENLTIKLVDPSTRDIEKNGLGDLKNIEKTRSVSPKPEASAEAAKTPEKPKTMEKPSIPEKTKRILDRIESRFSEINKNSPTKVSRPRIIDTGYDDFVDPVADLPLDDVPVKPALELDSLKVPEFNPYMLRPHAEPLRSKSLSLAEEKAPIDTLLSPEVENKVFVQQDVSPKRAKKTKTEAKKDFKKQSKSLEGDKPPLKKSGSKESRISPASSKIDKSKLKLGEMPQEIIIIDSTDVVPEVSIVQKGRSKSVTRLPDRSFSGSREEKDDPKKPRAKSASVDDDMIKGAAAAKTEKQRPKSLGISKSLGSTERETMEKVSPKKASKIKSDSIKPDVIKIVTPKHSPSKVQSKTASPEPVRVAEPVAVSEVSQHQKKSSVVKESSSAKLVTDMDQPSSKSQQESKDDKSPTAQKSARSPVPSRKPGQTPVLFARARLGLSEGSAISSLQRQGATQSPTAQRRAKSLDAPVISVHKLPAANAFSSKDDTVDTLEESEDQENDSPDNADTNQVVKQQSMQMEASPNHRSESTDHTTVPEIFTDSLSMTETSAQYLESPLTECQEITTCPDLIPYEHDAQVQSASRAGYKEMVESTGPKIDGATRFIDQSSVESGAETDMLQDTSADIKTWTGGSDFSAKSPISSRSKKTEKSSVNSKSKESERSRTEISSGTDSSDGDKRHSNRKTSPSESGLLIAADEPSPRGPIDGREEVPNVTVSIVDEKIEAPAELVYLDSDETPDMVKSPIQISIEECSDGEAPPSDEIHDDILDQAIFQAKQIEKRRLDSGDTSEDTLDALDAQVQLHGVDSDLSSPDYGVDKMDEKTLVEVELTPEYLEMRKEDEEGAEELPEDEPAKEQKDIDETNKLGIDKKYRLSTERSRSEETNTWTPDREDPDSSSCSIARPLGIGQIQPIFDRREIAIIKESRKEGSLEEESSCSGSQPAPRLPELSSTWKPFPLESSASSSLDDGWMPQDDNNHHQSQSEDSNGPNEDSFQEDLDFPTGLAYPINPDMIANYGAFALSRTLSRISERSTTSEQDKSDLEDSFKPSSRSPSLDDESLISSDHQPSLSSDPPSGTALPSVSDDRRTSSELPDIPIDVPGGHDDDTKSPRARKSRLQLQASEDWPSPPSSPLFDTPVVSHVETFYMEIKPEEAVRVTVTDSTDNTPGRAAEDSDSSDENRTLHDDLHSTLLEDGQSSASATTIDGTVKIAVKPKSNSYITGSSHSEDTSMGLSMSEWSSSNNTVRQFCQYSGTKSDDNSLAELGASISDWSGSTTVIPQEYYSAVAAEKSQSDTTTSDKSVTSMRPNSKCQHIGSPPPSRGSDGDRGEDDMSSGGIYADDPQYGRRRCESVDGDDNDGPADEFDEARKFVESQFHEHRRRFEDGGDPNAIAVYTDISPPRITFQNEYDETVDEDIDEYAGPLPSIPGPIPEEDEEDQLYDNVPAMKYSSGDQVRMKVSPGDSSEDMHERYADLASRVRSGEEEWSFDEHNRTAVDAEGSQHRSAHRFDRGYSEPIHEARYATRSTERPVIVPTRAKSTPYYSTTSLSGESTTSSPPMQIRAQIRTKTMAYSSCRSPQSEGDTSSSMDSPGHTPDRGQRAYRRKRQQNAKRRHRIAVDLEVRDGHIVSSTDSSFDVTSLPPPLLVEPSIDIADEDEITLEAPREEHEQSGNGNGKHHPKR